MLKTEFLNDGTLVKTFSDAGKMILQVETGIMYSEAIDPVEVGRVYEETDIDIDADEDDENISGDEFLEMIEEAM